MEETPTQQSVNIHYINSPVRSPTPTPASVKQEILEDLSPSKARKSKKKPKVKKTKTVPVPSIEPVSVPDLESDPLPIDTSESAYVPVQHTQPTHIINSQKVKDSEIIPPEPIQITPDSSAKDPQESVEVEKIVPLYSSDLGLFEDIQTSCSILLKCM